MSDIDIPDGWMEIPPEMFDTRTFVTEDPHRSKWGPSAHVSYYDASEHTVEIGVLGDYDFHYYSTQAEAFDRIETAMNDALDELESNDD